MKASSESTCQTLSSSFLLCLISVPELRPLCPIPSVRHGFLPYLYPFISLLFKMRKTSKNVLFSLFFVNSEIATWQFLNQNLWVPNSYLCIAANSLYHSDSKHGASAGPSVKWRSWARCISEDDLPLTLGDWLPRGCGSWFTWAISPGTWVPGQHLLLQWLDLQASNLNTHYLNSIKKNL